MGFGFRGEPQKNITKHCTSQRRRCKAKDRSWVGDLWIQLWRPFLRRWYPFTLLGGSSDFIKSRKMSRYNNRCWNACNAQKCHLQLSNLFFEQKNIAYSPENDFMRRGKLQRNKMVYSVDKAMWYGGVLPSSHHSKYLQSILYSFWRCSNINSRYMLRVWDTVHSYKCVANVSPLM